MLEVLKKKKALKEAQVERVTFNAITKASVLEAMANPRQLDMELVDAYLARRALDYLVGFTLSPVLAQAAGGSLRRTGAVGGPAHRGRPRDGDRAVQAAGILVHRSRRHR